MHNNTTPNTAAGNTSSLQKQKVENTAPQVVKLSSIHSVGRKEKTRLGFFRRVAAFILAVSNRILRRHKRNLPISAPQETIILLAEQEKMPPVMCEALLAPALPCTGTKTDKNLRKLAERQFMEMDTSHTTMN